MEKLLKVGDVAEMLQITTRSVFRLSYTKRFPRPLVIGGSRRGRVSDIEKFLKKARKRG